MVNELFKVLGDYNRLRIFMLVLHKEVCVCEIENILKLSQTNTSRHLSKLKSAGILRTTKQAQWIYYHIDDEFRSEHKELIKYITELQEQKVYLEIIEESRVYLQKKCVDGTCK